jgi:HK97 family phage portal protein
VLAELARGLKATITLGGTGQPFVTPRTRDIVYADVLGMPEKVAGVSVTPEKAIRYIPFFAAVRAIAEDLASLPLKVYITDTRETDRAHPVYGLLNELANPFMTAMTFRETLQAHALTWGNGFAEKEFATDGSLLAMWPLRPDRMQVLVDVDQLVYRFTKANGQTVDLPPQKVFHVHGLGFDGLTGYSVIEIARRTLALGLAAHGYGEDFFEKGGLPQAVLRHPKTLSDTARTNLRASIDGGSLSRRDRVAMLEEGMDLQVLGIPAKDSEFLAAGDQSQRLMAVLFRMPPWMLSDVDRSTSWGTGIEQQGIAYVKHTLRAWLTRWEQTGKVQLLAGEDRYLRHVVDALLRGDTASRWAAYTAGFDRGIYSIDDILALEDRDALPDGLGAQHFVPLNMVPVDQAGQMTLKDRLDALRGLTGAGFQPASIEQGLDLPPIELEPVGAAPQGTALNGSAGG